MNTGKMISAAAAAAILAFSSSQALAADSAAWRGNTKYDSYSEVKGILKNQVFSEHRETLYCSASYDKNGRAKLPKGEAKTGTAASESVADKAMKSMFFSFAESIIDRMEETWNASDVDNDIVRGIVSSFFKMMRGFLATEKDKTAVPAPTASATSSSDGQYRVNWEHIVPAADFGRTFREWREGHPDCSDKNGSFKGRKCAEKASREFRLMHADMYNLYPAVDAVNKARGNLEFAELGKNVPSAFGACAMKIKGSAVEPPEASRGIIARAYRYMAWAYPRYKMSPATGKLMEAWDKMYPATDWECRRAEKIRKLQGNENPFTTAACKRKDSKKL